MNGKGWPNSCYIRNCVFMSNTGICEFNGKKVWYILRKQIPCPQQQKYDTLEKWNKEQKYRCTKCDELCERLINGECEDCYLSD